MDNRFTTEPNGHYAGLWYDLPDGTKQYYTLEEVANQQRIYRKGSDSADAIQEAIDTRNHQPVGIQFSANAKARKNHKKMTDLPMCEICGKQPVRNGKSKTCASPECIGELIDQTVKVQRQKRKAKVA